MQEGLGTTKQQPHYLEIINQSNKACDSIAKEIDTLCMKLEAVMESESPKVQEAPTKECRTCQLEDDLIQLRNKIEGCLIMLRNVNGRIRL